MLFLQKISIMEDKKSAYESNIETELFGKD